MREHSAAFGRLRVETAAIAGIESGEQSAAFGRLRVETINPHASLLAGEGISRLRAAAC